MVVLGYTNKFLFLMAILLHSNYCFFFLAGNTQHLPHITHPHPPTITICRNPLNVGEPSEQIVNAQCFYLALLENTPGEWKLSLGWLAFFLPAKNQSFSLTNIGQKGECWEVMKANVSFCIYSKWWVTLAWVLYMSCSIFSKWQYILIMYELGGNF